VHNVSREEFIVFVEGLRVPPARLCQAYERGHREGKSSLYPSCGQAVWG
jgi:hypothetical protein